MIASSWLAPDSFRDIQDHAVQLACDARLNWTEYLQLIDRHRTPATSWAALKRTPRVYVPEPIRRELQRRSDLCRWQAMLHLQLLTRILHLLNQSRIPVMPLKGPLLSFDLHGDVGLRQSKDLDILVPQGEIRRTQECLESVGWRLGAEYCSLSLRQWEATLRHEYHVGYVHPQQGCQLELHWRCSLLPKTEQHWARSRTAELAGSFYQAMSPADLAIYLAEHGGKHQWFRAKWLGDLARFRCNSQVDWMDVLAHARIMGLERPVLLGLQLVSDCYDLPFPSAPGSLRKRLPDRLASRTVRALTGRGEPIARSAWTRFKDNVRTFGYYRMLCPSRFWWSWVIHRRQDFRLLPLPDRFFWLYIPLRPLLWLWRTGIALHDGTKEFCKKIADALSVWKIKDLAKKSRDGRL
jgi:hypothetical protein